MKIILYDKATIKRNIISITVNLLCIQIASINCSLGVALFVIFNCLNIAVHINGTNMKNKNDEN